MLTSNTFQVGMDQDSSPKFQKEGTYRYALNATLESFEGDKPSIITDLGNSLCASGIPERTTIIGHTLIDDGTFVLFIYDPALSRPAHQIGYFNQHTCTYTPIVIDQLLNFSDKHPINALFKIRNGCDKIIYFTDNYNEYRVINLTDTSYWVNDSTLALLNDEAISYSPNQVTVPGLSSYSVVDGGKLEHGSYSFFIRYLDFDQNPVTSFWPLTHFVKITPPLGASNVTSSPYYEPLSSKAVRFNVNNLSTKFEYFQIAVIKSTSDGGALSTSELLYPVQITASTATYTYTGNDLFGDITVSDILVPNQRIEKVVAHAIDERRLFLAGVTNEAKDYSSYQAFASKIKVTYEAVHGSTANDNIPTIPFGEVIALGAVFVHKDGTLSPVQHIPGRPKNPTELTSVGSAHQAPYLDSRAQWDSYDMSTSPTFSSNVYDATRKERWQVMSTASYNVFDTGYRAGLLGYYETSTNYPDIQTCSGDPYWGEDYTGTPITTANKIRHHRTPSEYIFPDTVTTPLDASTTWKLQLRVSNVTYPNTDVIGYYIVMGDRTTEKTVLDKGILVSLKDGTDANTDDVKYYYGPTHVFSFVGAGSFDSDTVGFVSPSTLFYKERNFGTYMTVEKILFGTDNAFADTNYPITIPEFAATSNIRAFKQDYFLQAKPKTRFNYKIDESDFLPRRLERSDGNNSTTDSSSNFVTIKGNRVENRTTDNDVVAFGLAASVLEYTSPLNNTHWDLTWPDREFSVMYVAIKTDRDVYSNLFNITYKLVSPTVFTAQSPSTALVKGGDSFVAELTATSTCFGESGGISFAENTQSVIGVESPYSHYYRYSNDIDRGRYSFYTPPHKGQTVYDIDAYLTYITSKFYKPVAGIGFFYPENYELDRKYNYLQPLTTYLPVSPNYEFCNDCRETFPYRIYYSQADNSETRVDPSRIVKINNYRDLDGTTGPITDLFQAFDKLYVGTTNAIYLLPTRPQVLTTDENAVEIGTGEVLSLPPRKLTSPDYALGGIQNFKSRVNTEFGTFYVDTLSRRPILLTSSPNDLSTNGLKNFFQSDGKLFLDEQFKNVTSQKYPINVLTHPYGIGYTSTFCPRTKTLYIAKRDYGIKSDYLSNFAYTTTAPSALQLTFNGDVFRYNNGLTTQTVTFDNTEFFFSKSFTLSYSFVTNSWISFHSFFPTYMMNDYQNYYTAVYDDLYKHNQYPYLTYNGNKYPHVIDLVATANPSEIKYANNIYYLSKSSVRDPNDNTLFTDSNATFNSIIAYNSYQTTGQHNLVLSTDPFDSSVAGAILVNRVERKYRLSLLRDYSISNFQPIWTQDPSQLQSQFYLDKVPNLLNINYDKSPFELARLRDHYLGIRLFFNPSDVDTKISTDIVQTAIANKNR